MILVALGFFIAVIAALGFGSWDYTVVGMVVMGIGVLIEFLF